ncbi:hypothetical protein BDZ97DRAFT_2081100 [Flammula alnicola]|nr:hypothetical protein BDZ97DRAFT_2081100 [Flammula alnicola]
MSNPTELPPIPPNIATIAGPQLIGTLFNWGLFGVLSVQTYVYYLNFPDDKTWHKILVYGTFIFEVVQTALSTSVLYFWFATGFGNLIDLGHVNLSPIETPIFCGLISGVVQCFFAYRIFVLQRSYWWICIVIVLTAIAQTVGAIVSFKLQEYALFHENVLFPQSANLWLIADPVCDVLISGTMLWLYYYRKRNEGHQHGTRILGRLVRLIVETNTLTAAMALASLILYVTIPDGTVFIATTLILGKLYSNTLLVTFNNRIAMRKTAFNEDSYGSGGSGRMAMHGKNALGSEGSTFRVASDKFDGKSADLESYEIQTMSGPKAHDLTSSV